MICYRVSTSQHANLRATFDVFWWDQVPGRTPAPVHLASHDTRVQALEDVGRRTEREIGTNANLYRSLWAIGQMVGPELDRAAPFYESQRLQASAVLRMRIQQILCDARGEPLDIFRTIADTLIADAARDHHRTFKPENRSGLVGILAFFASGLGWKPPPNRFEHEEVL
jgi:hypothetical protein